MLQTDLEEIREMVQKLGLGHRVWVNWADDGSMLGGVTREPDGAWTFYDESATSVVDDAFEAYDVLEMNIEDMQPKDGVTVREIKYGVSQL